MDFYCVIWISILTAVHRNIDEPWKERQSVLMTVKRTGQGCGSLVALPGPSSGSHALSSATHLAVPTQCHALSSAAVGIAVPCTGATNGPVTKVHIWTLKLQCPSSPSSADNQNLSCTILRFPRAW